MDMTRIAQPGRLGQPWVQEIVPGVFRVGTTFLGCYAVEDAGAYTFIDVGLPGYSAADDPVPRRTERPAVIIWWGTSCAMAWPGRSPWPRRRVSPTKKSWTCPAVPASSTRPGHTAGNAALSLADHEVLIVGDTLATLSLVPGESGPQLLPRFLNEDHDRALASLEKIEPVKARWVLPGHGLPWEGSPQQAVKLARQIAARTS